MAPFLLHPGQVVADDAILRGAPDAELVLDSSKVVRLSSLLDCFESHSLLLDLLPFLGW